MYARMHQVKIHVVICIIFTVVVCDTHFSSDDSQPKNQVPVLCALANLFAQEAGTSVINIHRWVRCYLMLMLINNLW